MANEQNIKNFTAADIADYHHGRLSANEMHALEKAALEDPFLADALEGYQGNQEQMPADLQDLNNRLAERIAEKDKKVVVMQKSSYTWLKIAAMIILIAGGGLLIYQLGFKGSESTQLAKEETPVVGADISATDSNPTVATNPSLLKPDSISSETTVTMGNATVVTNESKLNTDFKTGGSGINSSDIADTSYANLNRQKQPPASIKVGTNDQVAFQKSEAPSKEKSTLVTNDPAEAAAASAAAVNKREEETRKRNLAKAESKAANANSMGYVAPAKSDSYALANKSKNSFAAYNVFRGKVTDESNNPLPFVNITNPVDNVGTYSDAYGNFSMIYPDSVLNVNVRSLGFSNKATRLNSTLTDNRIVMQDDRGTLNELVISTKKINSKVRDNNMVLEEPEPADGWNNYDTYLANNLNVPETFGSKQSGGAEVELSFEVNKQGEPINIKVEKSLCETCDKEAIRALKEGPKWKRKAKKGRTSVTITF